MSCSCQSLNSREKIWKVILLFSLKVTLIKRIKNIYISVRTTVERYFQESASTDANDQVRHSSYRCNCEQFHAPQIQLPEIYICRICISALRPAELPGLWLSLTSWSSWFVFISEFSFLVHSIATGSVAANS